MDVKTWYSEGSASLINGLEVFFKRAGKGESLLCIHGFPSSSWDFAPIWSSLAEHFDVIASDLIGLGNSAKPDQSLPVSLQADIIEDLLIQNGIKEAHILAHDLGDTVAQELLARQFNKSNKVNWLSCVFLNGGLFPETHHPLLVQKILISPFGSFLANLMTERIFRKNMIRIFSNAHPPGDEFLSETWKLICLNNGKKMIPRLIRYMQERKENRERWVSPLVNNVVPLLLIDGVEDPISGEHLVIRIEELIPGAKVHRIKNSGHYPHIETPDEVLKSFLSFHQGLI